MTLVPHVEHNWETCKIEVYKPSMSLDFKKILLGIGISSLGLS